MEQFTQKNDIPALFTQSCWWGNGWRLLGYKRGASHFNNVAPFFQTTEEAAGLFQKGVIYTTAIDAAVKISS